MRGLKVAVGVNKVAVGVNKVAVGVNKVAVGVNKVADLYISYFIKKVVYNFICYLKD